MRKSKMKLIIVIAIIIVFAVLQTACKVNVTEKFSVTHRIAEHYPEFNFTFEYIPYNLSKSKYEEKKKSGFLHVEGEWHITVKNMETGDIIQTGMLDSVKIFSPQYYYFVDFNFDGYDDLLFLQSIDEITESFGYFGLPWSEADNEFLGMNLIMLEDFIVDTEKERILSRIGMNAKNADYSIFQFIDGELKETNRLELVGYIEEYAEDPDRVGKCQFSEYIIDDNREKILVEEIFIDYDHLYNSDSDYLKYMVNGTFGDVFSYDWKKAADVNVEMIMEQQKN